MKFRLERNDVDCIRMWFRNYVKTFRYSDPKLQQNIDIKVAHTGRVCSNIITLGKNLRLDSAEINVAEITALLHDTGRFEQFHVYRTFSDRNSEDHAAIGIKVLREHKVLDNIDSNTRELIFCSIMAHNKASVPPGLSEACLFYSRLLRDADKLDILRLMTDYYVRADSMPNGTMVLNLPDTPGFSKPVLNDLRRKSIVDIKNVHNLNDFKLLQLGWIFDINFKPSAELIKEKRYFEMIVETLPLTGEAESVINSVLAYRDNGYAEE